MIYIVRYNYIEIDIRQSKQNSCCSFSELANALHKSDELALMCARLLCDAYKFCFNLMKWIEHSRLYHFTKIHFERTKWLQLFLELIK